MITLVLLNCIDCSDFEKAWLRKQDRLSIFGRCNAKNSRPHSWEIKKFECLADACKRFGEIVFLDFCSVLLKMQTIYI